MIVQVLRRDLCGLSSGIGPDLMKTDPIDLDDFGDRKTGFEISVLFFGFAIEVQAHSLARDVTLQICLMMFRMRSNSCRTPSL